MHRVLQLEAHNPGAMTGAGNHTYLILADRGEGVLIDAGVGDPRHLEALDGALHAAGSRLDRVVVTHGHRDHASGAAAIARMHHDTVFAKYPWPDEDERHGVTWVRLDDDDAIEVGGGPMVVLHTPGHSPDHVALWHEPTRTAFTGDLVVAGSSVMIHWSRGGDLAQYMASLERLIALPIERMLPAHGPAIEHPAPLLTAYLEHRRERERQVVACLGAGRTTVHAIAESIYHGLDPALAAAARENVRAHLEKLKAEGRAFDDGGRWTL
jgi:glyoxylase-like metal-dependent hydrolase (beta-lactamase superfamily II)